jgi:hypothetical protein
VQERKSNRKALLKTASQDHSPEQKAVILDEFFESQQIPCPR